MENKARIAAAGRFAAYACAVYIAASTAVFAWRGTLFVAAADAWSFIATFLARYYGGTLTLADFFAKRDALDHSQPLQKLLFLVYARWFDLHAWRVLDDWVLLAGRKRLPTGAGNTQ